MTRTTAPAASTQAHEIRLIQIARQSLGLDRETYLALIARLGRGATSSTQLTAPQRRAVLEHMKRAGFVVQPKRPALKGPADEPRLAKLRALWWALADVGAVQRPADAQSCDAAIEAWARRQLAAQPFDALRFIGSAQLTELTEQLKRWARRVGATVITS